MSLRYSYSLFNLLNKGEYILIINIFKRQDLELLKEIPKELLNVIEDIIMILDREYGSNRKVNIDLRGYVVIVENNIDIEILKRDKLQGLIPEYTDVIKCSEGVNWTSSLFLLSSDFSIIVVCTEELSKFLLD